MSVPKEKLKQLAIDYALLIGGGIVFALSLNLFLKPSQIVPGGFTGLTTLLNYLYQLPIGASMFILNVPLFLYSYKKLGKEFTIKTLVSTFSMSAAIDLLAFLPKVSDDRLMCAIFGGTITGIGFSMIFTGGATSGGSDLLAKILIQFKKIPIGKMILIIDALVIIISGVIYQDINSAMYAIISLYIDTFIIDTILTGFDFARATYVITKKPAELSQVIMEELRRGVTKIGATGMYTKNQREMLLVVVKPKEAPRLKELIKRIDEDSFVIMVHATEVFGMGFKRYTQ